jgi:hypothetical protein
MSTWLNIQKRPLPSHILEENQMTFPNPDPNELEDIRHRFIDTQFSVPNFANWIATHAINDVHWLLGTIDGLQLGYGILLQETVDELLAEDESDE